MPTPNSNEQSELFNEGLPAVTGATSTTQAGEEDVLVIEETDLVTDVIRSEVNFLVLPFFALWDKDVERRNKTSSPIAQELINCGITKAVAIDLAESFSEEYLAEKIELHNYKKETGELTTNAAGWLREAIVHDYQLSEEQLKRKAQVEKRKAQQEEQKTLEEKAKQIQEQRLKEALANFPEAEQWVEERVVEHIKVREMTIEAFGGEQFTEEEISEMYLRYQAQTPKTDEEKRAWLISHDSEYALSSIIEEIRKEQQSQQEESKGIRNAFPLEEERC